MKKEYVKPVMEREVFVANEYVADCGYCGFTGGYDDPVTGWKSYGCGATVRYNGTLKVGTVIPASLCEIVIDSETNPEAQNLGSHRISVVTDALS